MPFDPTKPLNATRVVAAELRDQFNGLKALIDAVPAGPPGPAGPEGLIGPPGPVFSNVQVAGVTTGAPGTPAEVLLEVDGNNVDLTFTIPQGLPGSPGVTQQELTDAIAIEIAGTARNPAAVAPLNITISEPPTAAEVQAVVDKLNELIAALLR